MKTFKIDPSKYRGHTPGPWEWDERIRTWGLYRKGMAPNCHAQDSGICTIRPDAMGEQDPCGYYPGSPEQHANKNLIADAPLLLARVVDLDAEVERLRAALGKISTTCEKVQGIADCLDLPSDKTRLSRALDWIIAIVEEELGRPHSQPARAALAPASVEEAEGDSRR